MNHDGLTQVPASNPFPPSRHVYGKSASLCLSYVNTSQSLPTVDIQIAPALTGKRGYDWPSKIVFQLSQTELAQICAAISFPGPSLRFIHGDKSFQLANQAPKFLFTLHQSSRTFRVPVEPGDQHLLRAFLLTRLNDTQPLSPELTLFSLKQLSESLL